jgi:hypothetical protein
VSDVDVLARRAERLDDSLGLVRLAAARMGSRWRYEWPADGYRGQGDDEHSDVETQQMGHVIVLAYIRLADSATYRRMRRWIHRGPRILLEHSPRGSIASVGRTEAVALARAIGRELHLPLACTARDPNGPHLGVVARLGTGIEPLAAATGYLAEGRALRVSLLRHTRPGAERDVADVRGVRCRALRGKTLVERVDVDLRFRSYAVLEDAGPTRGTVLPR